MSLYCLWWSLLPSSIGPFKVLQCFDGDCPGVGMWISYVEVIDSFSFDAGHWVYEMVHVLATYASKAKTTIIPVVLYSSGRGTWLS